MSALAQYHAARGGRVTGSDRAFDAGRNARTRQALEAVGAELVPQDGAALSSECDAVIVSTAVEDTIPDIRRAVELEIPRLHRSVLLARYVAEKETIAVTGTSGKSTVVGMIFQILETCGAGPSLLTGGNLVSLSNQGRIGNAHSGPGPHLVIEADESDGSLVHYEAWLGVLLNLQRDHKEPEELAELFHIFRRRTRGPFVTGEDENLDPFSDDAVRFGIGNRSGLSLGFTPEALELHPDHSRFRVQETEFLVPVPGEHNVLNALAAIAAVHSLDLSFHDAAIGLRSYKGITRRFQSLGKAGDVEVIDDFGHNPAKIAATLRTARTRGRRVLAVFQPHGFGPTAFIRDELVEMLQSELRPEDHLWLLDIYYAGGTAERKVHSEEIADQARQGGCPVSYASSRDDWVEQVRRDAQPGDIVVVMGARDPSLTDLARTVLEGLQQTHS